MNVSTSTVDAKLHDLLIHFLSSLLSCLFHCVALLHCLNQNFAILHTSTAFQILLLYFILLRLKNSSTREWSHC